MKKVKTVLLAVIGLLVCAVSAAAPTDPQARRQQMLQDAQSNWQSVERALKVTLEKVNLNQRLTDEQIKRAAQLVDSNRRFLAVYDLNQKTGYLLLSAWTAYFQKDYQNALNIAMRAYRDDPTNSDAWATQALMSLAQCRRPMDIGGMNRQRGRARLTEPVAPEGMPFDGSGGLQAGTLNFAPSMLRLDLMRQKLTSAEWKTVDGKTVAFKQGETLLGLLIWQHPLSGKTAAAAEQDPFAQSEASPAGIAAQAPEMPAPLAGFAVDGGGEMTPTALLAEQQAYLEMLSELLAKKPNVVLAEMCLNPLSDLDRIKKERISTAPLIMARDAASGAEMFTRWQVDSPTLLLVNPDGAVCYAGPAFGLAPAFLLSHWTDVTIDLAAFHSPPQEFVLPEITAAAVPTETPTALPMPPMPVMPGMPGMPMPPEMAPAPENVDNQTAEKKYKDLPPEQQADAEKKLEYARDVFMKAAKLRVQTYRRGVEICRDILQRYPDTIYAEQARALLRQVPERQRAQYNLTPEELGILNK